MEAEEIKKEKQAVENKRFINQWQKKIMPFLIIVPSILIVTFICLATWQASSFQTHIENKEKKSIHNYLPNPLDEKASGNFKNNISYIKWLTLADMEEQSLQQRYDQGNMLLLSRIFIKYLGFLTGMILAIVGAIFIIAKLSEDKSEVEGSTSKTISFKLSSSSPGIVFGVLGTILMISTIMQHTEISIKDSPLYLNGQSLYIMEASSNRSPQIIPDSLKKSLYNDDAQSGKNKN